MDYVELTESLVKAVAHEKNSVKAKQFASDDDYITIQVLIEETDMGRVIGKGGKLANAIRMIVQASASNNNDKVRINIDSY